MVRTHSSIATDSEAALRDVIGDDATATFEDDPKFIDSDPTGTASSENVEVQRDTDDVEEDDEVDEDDLEDEDIEDEDIDEDDEDAAEDEDEDEDADVDAAARRAGVRMAGDEDDDAGDVEQGVDQDELDEDDTDTDRVADSTLRMSAY